MGRSYTGNAVGSAVLRAPDADAASQPGAPIATKSAQYGRTQAAGLRAAMSLYPISDDHERRDPEAVHDERAVGRDGEAQVCKEEIAVLLSTLVALGAQSTSPE